MLLWRSEIRGGSEWGWSPPAALQISPHPALARPSWVSRSHHSHPCTEHGSQQRVQQRSHLHPALHELTNAHLKPAMTRGCTKLLVWLTAAQIPSSCTSLIQLSCAQSFFPSSCVCRLQRSSWPFFMYPSLKLQPCSCPALSPNSPTSAFPAREMAHKATFLASPWAATLRSGATGPALLWSVGLSPLRWQGKSFQASLTAPGPSNLTSSAHQAGHSPVCSRRDHGGDQAGLP